VSCGYLHAEQLGNEPVLPDGLRGEHGLGVKDGRQKLLTKVQTERHEDVDAIALNVQPVEGVGVVEELLAEILHALHLDLESLAHVVHMKTVLYSYTDTG
jgi:hypothetical protein